MHVKKIVLAAGAGVACVIPAVIALAGSSHGSGHGSPSVGLVREVREATVAFRDVAAAEAAGYASMGSCVSGPQEGAMGIHYVNGALVGDGALDARRPEVVMYEQRSGRLRLLGVEFIVLAADWHANNPGPPVLPTTGQHPVYSGPVGEGEDGAAGPADPAGAALAQRERLGLVAWILAALAAIALLAWLLWDRF